MAEHPVDSVAEWEQSAEGRESLKRNLLWLYGDENRCKCDSGYRSLGALNGIQMGKGWVRLNTHPKCPEHALCQGYTAEVRAKERNGQSLYCNVHRTRNCPDGDDHA